jgi:beta-glucosidase
VQVYVGFPPGAGEPPWQLKAFDRIVLDPGQQRPFHFDISRRQLSVWDERQRQWRVPPGVFKVRVGNSSSATSDSTDIDLRSR